MIRSRQRSAGAIGGGGRCASRARGRRRPGRDRTGEEPPGPARWGGTAAFARAGDCSRRRRAGARPGAVTWAGGPAPVHADAVPSRAGCRSGRADRWGAFCRLPTPVCRPWGVREGRESGVGGDAGRKPARLARRTGSCDQALPAGRVPGKSAMTAAPVPAAAPRPGDGRSGRLGPRPGASRRPRGGSWSAAPRRARSCRCPLSRVGPSAGAGCTDLAGLAPAPGAGRGWEEGF